MDITVVIPAYNEEKRIVKTLIDIDLYFKKSNFDYEILVVNDGSTDATVKTVENLGIENLKIINNKKNMGKGYVVRQGLLAGKGKYRLFTDADNATPIDQLNKFLPYLEEYEVMIASREAHGAQIVVKQPFHRKVLGDLYRMLAKFITGLHLVKDSQCGFKLFTERAVNAIMPKCTINGLSFDVELLVIAQKLGYKINEIPVVWVDAKGSKATFYRMQKSVFELLMIRWNLMRGVYRKP